MEWNLYIETFLSWPLIARTACVLFVIVVVFGTFLGKYLLRLLSVIPFLLSNIFRGLYIAIERFIALFHKKYGGSFYDMANAASHTAEKMDSLLLRWHSSWRHAKHTKLMWVLLVYFAAVLYIGGVPMLAGTADAPIAGGGRAYLRCESALINLMEEHGLYMSPEKVVQETVFMRMDSANILKESHLVKLADGPILENGRPYIPVRSTMESILEGTVGWDKKAAKVIVQQEQTIVKLSTSTTLFVNGAEQELAHAPVEINSKIYVDAEEFFELFGRHAFWYEKDGILAVRDAAGSKLGPLTLQLAKEQLKGSYS